MFAALLVRQASKLTRIPSLQFRGYLRKNLDKHKPLLKFPKLKDSTHFKRDRMDARDVELIYKSPMMSSELAPPAALAMNFCILGWVGWSLLEGYTVADSGRAESMPLLPQNKTDLVLASVVFTALFVATYLYAKCNIMRIYYHVERQHFVALHCNPFWYNTRITVIQPGAPKPSKVMPVLLDIPGLMVPQFVDPESFKTPQYYHVFMGHEKVQNLRNPYDDGIGDIF